MTDTALTPTQLRNDVLRHLTFTLGKDVPNASRYDWRMSIGMAVRFESMDPITRHIIDAYLDRSRSMLGQRAS
mgnify:CR=1 FL=1